MRVRADQRAGRDRRRRTEPRPAGWSGGACATHGEAVNESRVTVTTCGAAGFFLSGVRIAVVMFVLVSALEAWCSCGCLVVLT